MNNDLISRRALMDEIKNHDWKWLKDNREKSMVLRLIGRQPTAYDTDKVVEQLSEIEVHRNEYSEIVECNIEPCRGMSCYECILDKAIEIVKGGKNDA